MSMTIKYQTAKQRLQQVDQIETIPKDATLIWCDFSEPTAADNEILQSYFNFNKLEIDDTVNGTPRAKYKAYDTYQYIVFHSVTHDNTIKALNLFIKDNMLITYHHKPFAILSDVEQLITEHFQPDLDTSDLVLHILDKMVDSYFKPITEIEDKVYAFEDHQVDESTNKTVMDKVYKIRSQIIQIKRIIYPMRELVDDLKESHILLVDNKNHMYIQHIDDHLIKQVNILKIAQEMTNEIRDNYSSYTLTR